MSHDPTEGKRPPCDLESEAAVLAIVMIDGTGQKLDQIAGFLKIDHFYSESHRRIYEACLALHSMGKPTDTIMVGTRLRETDRMQQIGGISYLSDVCNVDMVLSHLEHYARTVQAKWRVREAIQICQRVAAEGYVESGDVQEFLDRAEQAIHEIARSQTAVPFETIGTVAKRTLRTMAVRAKGGKTLVGHKTGYEQIDAHISGLVNSTLTIIAARPSDGKSALGLRMAKLMAAPLTEEEIRANEKPKHVAFFCLEMLNDEMAVRILSDEASVDQGHIYNVMQMRKDEWGDLGDAVNRLTQTNLHLCDDPSINVFSMRAMVRRLRSDVARAGGELVAVFVDYLQLMESPDMKKGENREREVSKISRGLKKMAKEMDIPVVAICQLNRQVEQRAGASSRPKPSDLRESGSLEQDANNILLIHHEKVFPKDAKGKPTNGKPEIVSEIIIAKARNGRKGVVKVDFIRPLTRFKEIEKKDDESEPDESRWT